MYVWAVAAWPQVFLHDQLKKELLFEPFTLIEACVSEWSPLCLKGADYLKTKQQLYLKWVAVVLVLTHSKAFGTALCRGV